MKHIIGIDCAVDDANVGLALGTFEGERLQVVDACPGNFSGSKALATLKKWIEARSPSASPVLLAIDAPLGWPEALGPSLVGHRAGLPLLDEPNLLFRRRTDGEIKDRIKRQPLDVGADRIARTAHRALKLLAELAGALGLREIPLAWEPGLQEGVWAIEVYPAATLAAYLSRHDLKGYKEKGAVERRAEIIDKLAPEHLTLGEGLRSRLEESDHILDAVVCLLAGADFLRNRAEGPAAEDRCVARKEGWIWCRGEDRASEPGDRSPGSRKRLAGGV